MKVPAFADIGKQANDLLYGAKSKGKFQYDSKVTLNMKSVEGVVGTAKAVKAGEKFSTDFTLKYAQTFNKNVLTLEGEPAMKKIQATIANQAIEGLKVQLAASVPNAPKTIKLTTEYAQPYLNSKAVVTLKEQNPIVDVAAATGYNGFVFGASTQVDARNSKLGTISIAAAYMGADFAATAHTDAQLKKVTGTYWQQLDAASNVAAEVKHDTEGKDVALNMGYSHFSPASGNLYKVKFGTEGVVELLQETKMRPDTNVAISVRLDALNLSQDPKFGLAIDHSP